MGLALLLGAYQVFFLSDRFALKQVVVAGDWLHLTPDQVIKLAGIRTDQPLFAINLYRINRNLRLHPWIESVEIRRFLPDTLHVHVWEHQPIAVVEAPISHQSSADREKARDAEPVPSLYLMNTKGVLFKQVQAGEGRDLPRIDGFGEDDLRRYPRYYGEHLARVHNFLSLFLKRFAETDLSIRRLTYDVISGISVDVHDASQARTMQLFFGIQGLNLKLDWWDRFYHHMKSENVGYSRVDLHAKDKIYARLAEPGADTPAADSSSVP